MLYRRVFLSLPSGGRCDGMLSVRPKISGMLWVLKILISCLPASFSKNGFNAEYITARYSCQAGSPFFLALMRTV